MDTDVFLFEAERAVKAEDMISRSTAFIKESVAGKPTAFCVDCQV